VLLARPFPKVARIVTEWHDMSSCMITQFMAETKGLEQVRKEMNETVDWERLKPNFEKRAAADESYALQGLRVAYFPTSPLPKQKRSSTRQRHRSRSRGRD
jgi:hypothetical protein